MSSGIFVSPRKARAMLDVSRSTLRRWEAEGILRAWRLKDGSGHRRYLVDDLRDIINGRCSR